MGASGSHLTTRPASATGGYRAVAPVRHSSSATSSLARSFAIVLKAPRGRPAPGGAADIDGPRVLAEAGNANLRVIDISSLATSAGSGHDGFTAFATIYGRLQTRGDGRIAAEVGPGVYALDAAGRLRPLDATLAQTVAAR